ncbi:F-box At5g51380-like [Olea europaea subsp. europaea]|uniref:F-box At5g51380-like n=1 Tax=Olea europaea subsp. europaea TaxID=158383 RepID=A0A8S0R2A1_OLEEU|nr:F-box At5g51380-like [Olea europaea subsp. europaea]
MPSPPDRSPDSNLDRKKTPAVKKNRRSSWSGPWLSSNEALKNVVLKMRLQSLSNSSSTTPPSESEPESDPFNSRPISHGNAAPDYSSMLSDKLLLKILSKISDKKQHISNSLVCKRWCMLSGKLINSIKLLDWEFLESGRLSFRFPNLVDVNIVPSCIKSERNSGILLSNRLCSVYLDSEVGENEGFLVKKGDVLGSDVVDRGVRILAEGCGNLRKVVLMNVSEEGLSILADECELLQEMELLCCGDSSLKGIFKCQNLQMLKLVSHLDGIYDSVVSDIGMTILAQGCRRLLRLELVGCEGSYDGIKAIGHCCQMLEELVLCDHRMDGGWLSALSYCGNLKTLRIQSCKSIDSNPGPDEHLGYCPTLEELHVQQCQMREKLGVRALFLVCRTVSNIVFEDCWGLDNSIFNAASICRSVTYLSLEGCSLLTMEGLESVIPFWKKLDRLRVVACNNIKDSEITPELATLFSVLKELKWRPDSRSLMEAGLAGTGVGQKGGRSLRK